MNIVYTELMLDSIAEPTYRPYSPEAVDAISSRIDPTGALDKLLTAYNDVRRLRPDVYSDGGVDHLITDLTADAADFKASGAPTVLGKAQNYLTRDEIIGIGRIFQQTRTFWRDILANSQGTIGIDERRAHKSIHEVLQMSSANQRLAQLVYDVGFSSPDSPERRTLSIMRDFLAMLGNRTDAPLLSDGNNILEGAFAQAAVMRGLQDRGYYIMIPDPDDKKDMENTDMKGIDFVAISPDGDIYLIDSKGNKYPAVPKVTVNPTSLGLKNYVFQDIHRQKDVLAGRHDGLDIVLSRKNLRSICMQGLIVICPAAQAYMDIGQFNSVYEPSIMASIIDQVEEILDYETAS